MPESLPRRSIVVVAVLVALVAAACTAESTTSTDSSTTTAAPATSTTAAPDPSPPGGGTEPPGDQTTTTAGAGSDPAEPTTTTTAAVGGGPDQSVPIVDPASVEAFCALDAQLEDLADAKIGAAGVGDAESMRAAMKAFLTENVAVIDQYLAAAPAEIRDDVAASMAQTRAAVDDPALFAELVGGSGGDTASSQRMSRFIDANCADPAP